MRLEEPHRRACRVGSIGSLTLVVVALVIFPLSLLGFLPAPVVAAAPGAHGAGMNREFHFTEEEVHIRDIGEYDVVTYRGAEPDWSPAGLGHPQLPVFIHRFILPPDTRVSDLVVTVVEADTLPGRYVPVPIQSPRVDADEPVAPDLDVYESWLPYPEVPARLIADGHMRGYHLASVLVYPLHYVGALRKLVVLKRVQLNCVLRPMTEEELNGAHRSLRPDRRPFGQRAEVRWIKEMVLNPEDLETYYRGSGGVDKAVIEENPYGGFRPTELPSLEGPPVDYVVITDNVDVSGLPVGDMVSVFQELADWKTDKGVPAVVRTVRWIEDHYSGVDRPEKIRNFIKDAWKYWGTAFVLLGGDIDIVPSRFLGAPESIVQGPLKRVDPPADLYFAELEQKWNLDGDAYFGEATSELNCSQHDFYDVWIGRMPARTSAEARVIVDKIFSYVRFPGISPPPDSSFYDDALLVTGPTLGANAADGSGIWFTEKFIAEMLEAKEIDVTRLYAQIPTDSFECRTVYDDTVQCYKALLEVLQGDETIEFTYENFRAHLNEGYNYVWHVEHSHRSVLGDITFQYDVTQCSDSAWIENCKESFWEVNPNGKGQLHETIVDDLTNGPHYSGIVISGGSFTNKWDQDCIGEHFLRAPGGGSVAYFGRTSSRGHYYWRSAQGFFHNVFDVGIQTLGIATGMASSEISSDFCAAIYWSLLGDPEMPLWTKSPGHMTVLVDPLEDIGAQTVVVEVDDAISSEPIEGARVCLRQGDLAYSVLWTNESGIAYFYAFTPTSTDSIGVVVTAQGYEPERKRIGFGEVSNDYVSYQGHSRQDEDGDDVLEAGDTAELEVTVRNLGTSQDPIEGLMGYLWRTPPVSFGLNIEGEFEPEKIYIGAQGAHPPSVEETFRIPGNWEAIRPEGAPNVSPEETSYLVWRDTDAIWHVSTRFTGDADSLTGTISTEGGIELIECSCEEDADSLMVWPNRLWFNFFPDSTNDELMFRAEARDWVDVRTDGVDFGTLTGGGTASGDFLVSWTGSVPDNNLSVFTLAMVDADENWWFSDFSETVHAPAIRHLVQRTVIHSGPEGRELLIWPTLSNLGSATADSCDVVFHKTGGSGVVENDIVRLRSITAGDTAKASDPILLFDSNTPPFDGLLYALEIYTYHPNGDTTVWVRENLDIEPPSPPTGLIVDDGQGSVTLRWDKVIGIEGYHVFRCYPDGSVRLTRAPLMGTTRYEVAGLDPVDEFGERLDEPIPHSLIDYLYAVTAVDFSGNESGKAFSDSARAWFPEHKGWPRRVRSGSLTSPMAINIDHDDEDKLEIFAAGKEIYAWRDNGDPLIEGNEDGLFFEPSLDCSQPQCAFVRALAFGDIDNDGNYEIAGNVGGHALYVMEYDAATDSVAEEWSTYFSSLATAPILADLDGNGTLEIILTEDEDQGAGWIHAWHHNGEPYEEDNWPIEIAPWHHNAVAVGDVVTSTDGVELVVASQLTGFSSYVICFDGMTGDVVWDVTVPGPFEELSTPVIGDLDNDQEPEVVVARRVAENASCVVTKKAGVFVLDGSTGAIEDSLTSTEFRFAWGSGGPEGGPVLSDVDGDDTPEIVIGGGECGFRNSWAEEVRVHVFHLNGSELVETSCTDKIPVPGRKEEASSTVRLPVVCNLDMDDRLEIVTVSNSGYLNAWEWDAEEQTCAAERGWPHLFEDIPGTPQIVDVDANSDLELVVQDLAGVVHVFDLSPMYGSALSPDMEIGDGESIIAFRGVRPNPFNPSSIIELISFLKARVRLGVYDVSGRLVRVLVDDILDAGLHTVSWDGRSDGGLPAASGVYFYRLEAQGQSKTRTVVLLR